MSLRLLSILLLFLSAGVSKAAPVEDIPLTKSPAQNIPAEENEESVKKLNNDFTIAEPPPTSENQRKKINSDIYSYTQSFSFGPGLSVGTDSGFSNTWNFIYVLPSNSARHFETGAYLSGKGTGAFHFGVRQFYLNMSSSRPYWKATVAMQTDSESGLAEFVELDNYRVQGAVGVEKLWISPISCSFEMEGSAGKSEQFLFFKVALSWAWY